MNTRVAQSFSLFLIAVIASLYGCFSPVYYPNAVSNPMLDEKGDASVAVHGGLYGGDIQTAIALTDHIGFTLNGQYQLRNSMVINSYIFRSQGIFGEFGALGFFDFGTNGKFEIMTGYGKGLIEGPYTFDGFIDSQRVIQRRTYLQPTVGWKHNNSSVAISYRMTVVEMEQKPLVRHRFFMEPVVTLKTGTPRIKFTFQAGFPIYAIYTNEFGATPLILNLGLQYNFNTFKSLNRKNQEADN